MLSSKMTEKGTLRYMSINDLLQKAKVDYKNKRPNDVSKRLPEMYNKAEENAKQGNEEDQYIMLRRWLNSIEWLKTTNTYRDDKIYSLTHLNVNQINEVKKMLAALKTKLETRYKQQAKTRILEKNTTLEKMDIDNDAEINSFMSSLDGPIQLPETPTRDPLAGDNEEIINCEQLFQLVQDRYGRYLIIDIRSKSQYENSRIRSDKSVNIPSSEIKIGLLAQHFEKYLRKDKKSLQLYRERSAQYVDVTILLDWNTSSKTLGPNNPLNVFRKILENWDPGIQNKKVTILDGGYTEWLTRYPAYTTNPNIAEPKLNNTSMEILDDIEYPEWIHYDDEDNLNKAREKKMLSLKSVNKEENTRINVSTNEIGYKQMDVEIRNIASIKSNDFMNSGSTITKNSTVELEKINVSNDVWKGLSKTPSRLEQERKLSARKKTNISVKPTVDRSKKPVLLDASTSEAKTVLKLLRQLNELAKIHMRLEQDILEHERSLYVQYFTEYEESSEEAYIRSNSLKSLCQKLEEKKKEYKKLEDELDKYYSRPEPIEFNPAEDMEKRNLEFSLGSAKLDMKNIAKARKKLGEKTAKNELKDSSNKADTSIHNESLKSDGSSSTISGGLERSYSSPNLLQLIDRKAPRVDRTSKPQIPLHNQNGLHSSEKVSHISWANREERMTPVHGSVHPGITGLKNLGNSCYMNSIIQCLSNTTHLAKYFTDNLYTDDLNTNNDNNTQGQVVEEVAQVIKALWRGQYKSISPHDLKIAVGQYKLQFESYEQQDSHEFLTFLLDWMHNDLKRKCKVSLDMTVAEEAWDKAMGSMKSIISDLFFGQLRSTITCSFCKQSSTTYESFNSLTTSLPHSNRCTLNDCILRFVTGQKVIGWKCPKCQTPREATKKFDFVKLAPIVVIHLNRFAESGGWLEKRNTAVDFPLTDFNLKPYLVTDSNTPTISNIRNYNYSLYAMSNHYGTMEGGHYTAYCKNAAQNKWYKYDDQTVTEVTTNQVKSQNTSAYLLFYTSFSSNII